MTLQEVLENGTGKCVTALCHASSSPLDTNIEKSVRSLPSPMIGQTYEGPA